MASSLSILELLPSLMAGALILASTWIMVAYLRFELLFRFVSEVGQEWRVGERALVEVAEELHRRRFTRKRWHEPLLHSSALAHSVISIWRTGRRFSPPGWLGWESRLPWLFLCVGLFGLAGAGTTTLVSEFGPRLSLFQTMFTLFTASVMSWATLEVLRFILSPSRVFREVNARVVTLAKGNQQRREQQLLSPAPIQNEGEVHSELDLSLEDRLTNLKESFDRGECSVRMYRAISEQWNLVLLQKSRSNLSKGSAGE